MFPNVEPMLSPESQIQGFRLTDLKSNVSVPSFKPWKENLSSPSEPRQRWIIFHVIFPMPVGGLSQAHSCTMSPFEGQGSYNCLCFILFRHLSPTLGEAPPERRLSLHLHISNNKHKHPFCGRGSTSVSEWKWPSFFYFDLMLLSFIKYAFIPADCIILSWNLF